MNHINKEPLLGKKIELHTPTSEEIPAHQAIYNHVETMEQLIPFFGRSEWSDELIYKQFAKYKQMEESGTFLHYSIIDTISSSVIGLCLFKDIDYKTKCAEFGIVIHKNFWGKGYAKEAHFLCFEFGFEKMGFEKIILKTDLNNQNMQKFAEKHFFQKSKLDTEDLIQYEISKELWSLSVKASLS